MRGSQAQWFLEEHDAFVFDVDDTLLYTFENGFHKINLAAEALGLAPIGFPEYAANYGAVSFAECIRRWFPRADVGAVMAAYAAASDRAPYRPVCDFSRMQRILAARGKRAAILTNGRRDAKLMRKLELCGTRFELLSGIWGAEDLPSPKPSPLALAPARAAFGDARLIYIGDASGDRDMARGAQIDFFQVHSGKEGPIPGTPGAASLAEWIEMLEA